MTRPTASPGSPAAAADAATVNAARDIVIYVFQHPVHHAIILFPKML